MQPSRSYSVGNQYRYGFNGKENDNEVKGEGSQQDYGMRIYDPRLGRFLSVDPLASFYPYYTSYQFAGNSPIANIDLDGAEPKPSITGEEQEGQQQKTSQDTYNARGDWTGKKSENWNWHAGGLSTGKYKDPNDLNSEIKTQAGWYSAEDYLKLLSGTNAAGQLAQEMALFSGPAGIQTQHLGAKNDNSLQSFVGDGLSENASNFLVGAARLRANNANKYVSGIINPSDINVEDLIFIPIALTKAGSKIFGGLVAKNMGLKEGKQLLLQAPEIIHNHHVLPQQFKGWFKKQGIKNIDAYTVEISSQTHLRGVHGSGLGNLPGQWNKKWSEFIKVNPNANPSEIFHQAEGMLKQYGLEHLPYVPYKK